MRADLLRKCGYKRDDFGDGDKQNFGVRICSDRDKLGDSDGLLKLYNNSELSCTKPEFRYCEGKAQPQAGSG